MRGTAAIASAIVVAGGLVGYMVQPRASADGTTQTEPHHQSVAQVRDGDVVPSDTVLPDGYGLECPRVLHGECHVVDSNISVGERAAQASAEAAREGGGTTSGVTPQGRPMFNLRDALAMSQLNVEGLLREPGSASYQGVWRVNVESGDQWMPAYCGRVSGRNAFGGRADYSRFVATPVMAMVEGNAGFDRFYRDICIDLPRVELVSHF